MILSLVLGACFGSFFGFLYQRVIFKKDIFEKRSSCLKCGKKLKFYMNIPIFSYLFLKGKCAYCKENINFSVFLFEIICALLFIISYFIDNNFYYFLTLSLFLSNLFLLSMFDIKFKAVPQIFLWFGVLLSFLYGFDLEEIYNFILFEEIKSTFLINFIFFSGIIFILKSFILFLTNFNKKDEILDNIGDADILIIACIGGILGIKFGFLAIFLASIFTLPFFIKRREIPFIPFLSLSFLIVLLFRKFYEISL